MRERIGRLDFVLIFCTIALLGVGLVALYSTSSALPISGTSSPHWVIQIRWILLSAVLVTIITLMSNRFFFEYAYFAYGIAIFLLILVALFGSKGLGATRWLRVGGVGFQPSEFAKIATLLAVARFLSEERLGINSLKTFAGASGLVLIPFLLIAKQPDLGTALVLGIMPLAIFTWAGLTPVKLFMFISPIFVMLASFNLYSFMGVMLLIVVIYIYLIKPKIGLGILHFLLNIGIGMLTPLLWDQLKDYQKQRILTFWNPEADPLGSGYQIIQSKVAIGSGGFLGKGFSNGTQTQLRFLPEQHTDFIFGVIGEEFGFIGVLLSLVLFSIFLMRVVYVASLFKSRFSSIIAIGIGTIIGFHMFVNIGMTVGLCPVTGLPLPFIGYGGSALLANMVMVGLLLNCYRHRFEY